MEEVTMEDIMSPEEFKKKMKEYSKSPFISDAHMDADALMMNVLESLGYGEGVEIFDSMEKWYA